MNKRILIILGSAMLVIAGIVLLVILSNRNDRNQSSSDTPTTAATEGVSPTEVVTNTPVATATPSPEPTATLTPTVAPTSTPTATPKPTKAPATPTPSPSPMPATPTPTKAVTPTPSPTKTPTPEPTKEPTKAPTKVPTAEPTKVPTVMPDTPTPTPVNQPTKVISPDEYSPSNLPEGFSTERQLVEYVAQYRVNKETVPVFQSLGFETVTITSVSGTGKRSGQWELYRVTVHATRSDTVEVEVVWLTNGQHYAECVVNQQSGILYQELTAWKRGHQLKKVKTSFSDLDNKIKDALKGVMNH